MFCGAGSQFAREAVSDGLSQEVGTQGLVVYGRLQPRFKPDAEVVEIVFVDAVEQLWDLYMELGIGAGKLGGMKQVNLVAQLTQEQPASFELRYDPLGLLSESIGDHVPDGEHLLEGDLLDLGAGIADWTADVGERGHELLS